MKRGLKVEEKTDYGKGRGPAEASLVPAVTPELSPRFWRLVLRVLKILPQAELSSMAGRVADVRLPRHARRSILGAFARAVGADVGEAELPLEDYETLNAFFARRLRPGLRFWPEPGIVGSPVDGKLGQIGIAGAGRLTQAKGLWYTAAELLDDEREARRFEGGSFLTLYLSPRHYHRVHTPYDVVVREARYLPGALLPVNSPVVAQQPSLFVRNERLVCHLSGEFGSMALVAVGAYNVGRISASFDESWRPPPGRGPAPRRTGVAEARRYDPGIPVSQGEELLVFHMGSTVILLVEPGAVEFEAGLEAGEEVRLGQPLARIRKC